MTTELSFEQRNALKHFFATYEVVHATTPELLTQVGEVRHAVFCEELQFDMDSTDKMEFDEYDTRSLHVLLKTREGGRPVATIRLVLPAGEGQTWLPFEHYGVPHVDGEKFDLSAVNKNSSIEFSRLAVLPEFRRSEPAEPGQPERPNAMFLGTAMYFASISVFLRNEIAHGFITIEPRLNRVLTRNGIHFAQISPAFEYYGKRATYASDREKMQMDIANLRPDLKVLYNGLDKQLHPEMALDRELAAGGISR